MKKTSSISLDELAEMAENNSMINIRPAQGNRSRSVEDAASATTHCQIA